ncbi:hypothetical protein QBC44DRAFT_313186 [Cladorrhinum sp. PSN332]|nr:hypothetical protein QBC44DRAFT_313186 [Cladorrhinum sp. PSN332]
MSGNNQLQRAQLPLPNWIPENPSDPPNEFLYRTDELSHIKHVKEFTSSAGAAVPKLVVIWGEKGVGKTELARTYALKAQRRKEFEAVFWSYVYNKNAVDRMCASRCHALNLKYDGSGQRDFSESSSETLRRWLAKPLTTQVPQQGQPEKEASWLLVAEDVPDLDLLAHFLPTTGPGFIIVTSRHDLGASTSMIVPSLSIELKPFDHRDSTRFLRGYLDSREFEHDTDYLYGPAGSMKPVCKDNSKAIGGLPADLSATVRMMDKAHAPVTTKLSMWQKFLSKPALALLQVLSFFHHEGMSESILESILEAKLNHVIFTDYPKNPNSLLEASTELYNARLISRTRSPREYIIQKQLQRLVRASLPADLAATVFEHCVNLLFEAWPFIDFEARQSPYNASLCRRLFRHVERVVDLFDVVTTARNLYGSMKVVRLMNEVAWYVCARGGSHECGTYSSIALEMFKHIPLREIREDEVFNQQYTQALQYDAISRIYTNSDTDKPTAVDQLNKMMDLITYRIKKWGDPGDELELADAWKDMGIALMRKRGKEKEAIEALEKSHQMFQRLPDFEGIHPLHGKIDRDWPAIHLALVYTLRNECDKAEKLLLPVIKAHKERPDAKYGYPNSMSQGKALHALGNIRRAQGRTHEAADSYKQGIEALQISTGANGAALVDTFYTFGEQLMKRSPQDLKQCFIWLGAAAQRLPNPREWQKPQAARAAFVFGMLHMRMGDAYRLEGKRFLELAMAF